MPSNKVIKNGQAYLFSATPNWVPDDLYFVADPAVEPIDFNSEIKELPCKACDRINDIGVKKCWWCCVDNPTVVRSDQADEQED